MGQQTGVWHYCFFFPLFGFFSFSPSSWSSIRIGNSSSPSRRFIMVSCSQVGWQLLLKSSGVSKKKLPSISLPVINFNIFLSCEHARGVYPPAAEWFNSPRCIIYVHTTVYNRSQIMYIHTQYIHTYIHKLHS